MGRCDVVMDRLVSVELERDSNAKVRVSKDIKSLTYIVWIAHTFGEGQCQKNIVYV